MAVGYERPAVLESGGLIRAGRSNAGLIVTGGIFVLLVGLLPPAISAAVLGAVALGTLLLVRPTLAVYLLVFAVPYESLRYITVGGLNASITEFVAFCGGIAFLVRGILQGQVTVRDAWWLRSLLFFGVAMIASISQATSLTSSIKEVLKLGEMLLTYLLVLGYIDSPSKLRRLLYLVALAAGSQALLGIVQAAAHFGPASFARGGLLRGSGTFDQPNPFAGYLNLTLPILFAAVIMDVPLVGRLTRPVLLILSLAVLLSLSRGALLASLAAIAVMLAVYSPRIRPLVVLGAVVFFALIGATFVGINIPGIGDKIAVVFGLNNVDVANPTPVTWPVAERLAHVLAGLNMFYDHPLLGVGIGNYPAAYPHYRVAAVWGPDLGHAHNYYVNIAAEAGIVGLAAFLFVLWSAFRIAVRLYRRATEPVARVLALGALGILATVVVHSFFDDIFVHAMEAQLALVMGMATVSYQLSAIRRQPRADG